MLTAISLICLVFAAILWSSQSIDSPSNAPNSGDYAETKRHRREERRTSFCAVHLMGRDDRIWTSRFPWRHEDLDHRLWPRPASRFHRPLSSRRSKKPRATKPRSCWPELRSEKSVPPTQHCKNSSSCFLPCDAHLRTISLRRSRNMARSSNAISRRF